MKLRLDGDGENALFGGEFAPVAFTNLWRRQQTTVPMDQALAAVYQSVLQNVVWQGRSESKVLEALRAASTDGFLAINFNVYGYGRILDSALYPGPGGWRDRPLHAGRAEAFRYGPPDGRGSRAQSNRAGQSRLFLPVRFTRCERSARISATACRS